MAPLIMIISAAAIIVFVKLGLLRGIDNIANAMHWSAKARGQITGYATSVPELVCLVSAGLAGVWEAGLWNIAASNIINVLLMMGAVLYYGQFSELFNRRFADEVGFAAAAVVVPIVLMQTGEDTHWALVPILLGFFLFYQVVDKMVNPVQEVEESAEKSVGSLSFGVSIAAAALVAIAIAGFFLGSATADVVKHLGIHPAIAGWILGVVTSIPETVSFFSVYAGSDKERRLQNLDDTQEVMDNLTGSNMANVGFVYPIGLLAFLVGAPLLGVG